jgi:hypothetical protein
MTATPIPRTLAMTLYGDLDVSVINEMPPGRIPVETKVVTEDRRMETWERVRKELAADGRAYIILPLVEESEKLSLRDAKRTYEKVREVFPDIGVGLLHGRMNADEKESVMRRFQAGEIRILVSTTVVEVGVDVPEATVMMVEHAERFGLSQLHQLRGRVGRGSRPSLCFLMVGNEQGEDGEHERRLPDRRGGPEDPGPRGLRRGPAIGDPGSGVFRHRPGRTGTRQIPGDRQPAPRARPGPLPARACGSEIVAAKQGIGDITGHLGMIRPSANTENDYRKTMIILPKNHDHSEDRNGWAGYRFINYIAIL